MSQKSKGQILTKEESILSATGLVVCTLLFHYIFNFKTFLRLICFSLQSQTILETASIAKI